MRNGGRRPCPALATRAVDTSAVWLPYTAVMLVLALGCGRAGRDERLLAAAGSPASRSAVIAGSMSPSARLDTVELLRQDLQARRHPADGAGRAWIELAGADSVRVAASSPGRFPITFEAGPLGIAEGGAILLQVSPFWGWSTPQVIAPDRPGFTTVSTTARGLDLEATTAGQQLLAIAVGGRALRPGERVNIVYGAGPAGAAADRYAERGSRLWIAVDGDGDGVRAVLADSPGVDVMPGRPARLVLTLPSVARPGEPLCLTIAMLDAIGNAGVDFVGEVELEAAAEGVQLPSRARLGPSDRGRTTVELEVEREGIVRILGRAGQLEAESNPLQVTARGPRVYWGDLHGHSGLSDGTGTPEDYFLYARDVAALDVIALTDHDHWGILFLDRHPELWREIREQTRRFHDPGRFVTLLGFEWTSWLHGHRHVLYFTDDGEVLSSMDPRYESPDGLWLALRGQRAMTFAHHSAGGPIATNWDFEPDPELEPVTEVASVHGSSEAPDSPAPIYSAVNGNYVRDVLDRGYRLGFVGGGDSHDGHPGLAHVAASSGGLTAIIADELTRESVYAALKERRVYATNGPRILLRMAVAGHPMGSVLAVDRDGLEAADLVVIAVTPAAIDRVDVIRNGEIVLAVDGDNRRELALNLELEGLAAGEYLYARVVQRDGGAAWASPVFVVSAQE